MSRAGPLPGAGVDGEPTLHELRAFVHLCEEMHFGRAAARLQVSQPSLSATIRRLEQRLGVVLFERTSRRVTLTDAAERLRPRATAVLDDVGAVLAAAGAPSQDEPASLRIGIEANGVGAITPVALRRFRARHPGASLAVREFAGASRAFFDGGFDACLVRAPLRDERLSVHEVAVEPRGMLVPADHPRADCRDASIVDFLDDPFVAVTPDAPSVRDHWIAQEHRGGERPNVGGTACTLHEALHAVAHRGLVTTAGRSIPRAYPTPGTAFVETPDLAPTTLGVAVRAGEARPLVMALVETVRHAVSDLGHRAPDLEPLPPPSAGRGAAPALPAAPA